MPLSIELSNKWKHSHQIIIIGVIKQAYFDLCGLGIHAVDSVGGLDRWWTGLEP